MSDIVFMDTETLGLDPEAPVWEFAAIRRTPEGAETEFHCFIDHYPLPWFNQLPESFQLDYQARYVPSLAITHWQAAEVVRNATSKAHVIGAVPSFDTTRLWKLLEHASPGFSSEPWHYHLVDVENMVVGYLASKGQVLQPPWKSDELSRAVGVDPEQFDRHTAMGDVLWVKAQYDAVMGGAA
jgi:hypothetical protein